MEWLTKELFSIYGPLSLGWVAAGGLLVHVISINKAFTRLVERNTEAITRLTTMFEERLPRGGRKP